MISACIGAFAFAAVALSCAALIGPGLARAADGLGVSGWNEIAWPFPRDAWEAGRAFKCSSQACEGDVVDVRPKIGFCNCSTGVTDDEEVDRVTDLDLIDPQFTPLGSGEQIEAAGMRGRARQYKLRLRDGTARMGVGIALSRNCDVVVAIAQSNSIDPARVQTALDLYWRKPCGIGSKSDWTGGFRPARVRLKPLATPLPQRRARAADRVFSRRVAPMRT